MSAGVLGHDAFAPPQLSGMRPGLLLSIVIHVLLVLALAWSVNWKTKEPDGVVAELWSATPQIAAPRPVAPQPAPAPTPPPEPPRPVPVARPEPTAAPPVDAQIAVQRAERERRLRDDAERVEAEKKAAASKRDAARRDEVKRDEAKRDEARREDAERSKQRLADEQADKKKLADKARQDDAKQAAIRAANLRRMMNQAGTSEDPSSTGTAAVTSGPSSSYAGIIRGRIKPLIQLAGSVPGNPTAVVEVRLASDGAVLSRRLVKSSGSGIYDDAVLRAIDKLGTFPKDQGRIYTPMTLEFHPLD